MKQVVENIVWIKDDGYASRYHALIGQYEYNEQMYYVFGVIYFGFPLDYGWDVRIGKRSDTDRGGSVIHAGDNTNDLEQAKRDAERIGKEWIESD